MSCFDPFSDVGRNGLLCYFLQMDKDRLVRIASVAQQVTSALLPVAMFGFFFAIFSADWLAYNAPKSPNLHTAETVFIKGISYIGYVTIREANWLNAITMWSQIFVGSCVVIVGGAGVSSLKDSFTKPYFRVSAALLTGMIFLMVTIEFVSTLSG
jgi:hypothetical protein